MLPYLWPSPPRGMPTRPPDPIKPKRTRSHEPKTFEGLTHKPHCALCERATVEPKAPPPTRPDSMPLTNRRPREVDTSRHFCLHSDCDYRGWLGLGNLRANPRVGLLFIDFESGSRLRVTGEASIDFDDPLNDTYRGAVCVVRVQARAIFANCRRYVHEDRKVSPSPFVPRATPSCSRCCSSRKTTA